MNNKNEIGDKTHNIRLLFNNNGDGTSAPDISEIRNSNNNNQQLNTQMDNYTVYQSIEDGTHVQNESNSETNENYILTTSENVWNNILLRAKNTEIKSNIEITENIQNSITQQNKKNNNNSSSNITNNSTTKPLIHQNYNNTYESEIASMIEFASQPNISSTNISRTSIINNNDSLSFSNTNEIQASVNSFSEEF